MGGLDLSEFIRLSGIHVLSNMLDIFREVLYDLRCRHQLICPAAQNAPTITAVFLKGRKVGAVELPLAYLPQLLAVIRTSADS